MSDAVMTTKEVAEELGTDSKTLRKFFRSDKCEIEPVGQGKRYAITPDDIDELRTAFDLWANGKAKKADKEDEEPKKAPAKKKKATSKKKPAPVIEDPDEDLDLDDLEPTAEDLDDIEDLDLDD
jgi:hypothetical protein